MPIRLAHACSAIAEQQRAMRAAPDYAAWQVAASRLDALEGHNDWRTDPLSPDYEYAQIQHQLAALRRWHKQGNFLGGSGVHPPDQGAINRRPTSPPGTR